MLFRRAGRTAMIELADETVPPSIMAPMGSQLIVWEGGLRGGAFGKVEPATLGALQVAVKTLYPGLNMKVILFAVFDDCVS
jgi:hypothetical protein